MEKDEGIRLAWHRSADMPGALLYEVLRFRQAIFVVEQVSPYEDLDGHDEAARHLLLRIGGDLAGYLRLIPEGRQIRIGRLAVAPAHRRRRLARMLMAEAFAVHRRDFPHAAIAISAQTHLVPFYRSLGFVPVADEYDDAGVPHIDMMRPLPS